MAKRRKRDLEHAQQIARKTFGFESLNPGQKAAIQAVMEGHDTLAVMPTGSGKSAIYQIAGLMLAGPTVIVSPLIALQKDQVESIEDQDLGGAAQVNSSRSASDRQEAFEELEEGDLEFLFLAPEQFNNPETLERLQAAKPSLFVVDEAHCISEWGHDFRPDYLNLGHVIEALGHPAVLALTATAAPPVRQEIVERLDMRDAKVVVQGFDRPNIWLAVERYETEDEKRRAFLNRVAKVKKPGIVYTATRKSAEELAEELSDRGLNVVAYHAGLKAQEREEAQTAFMDDEVDVIIATTAFGMGVDKPNVRFVFHYNISDSVDSYYQEIGRAGRDGELAAAVLFYTPKNLNLRRILGAGPHLEAEHFEQVTTALRKNKEPLDPKDLKDATNLSKPKLKMALGELESVGAIEVLPTGEVTLAEAQEDSAALEAEAVELQERHQEFERSRLEMIRGYAELRNCRRKYLLNYFGESLEQLCGFCDNCKAGTATEDSGREPFPLNSRVRHKSWGEGLVMRYEGDKIVVLFDQVGYKTLEIGFVMQRRILQPADSRENAETP